MDLGPDDLVCPPLVPHFVSDDVGDHVDIIWLFEVGDESDRFRVGHGPREGLGETCHAWELDDTRLPVFIRTKFLRAVLEGICNRLGHLWDIPRVLFVVVDLGIDVADFASFDLVSGRDKRIKVQRWVVHAIAVVIPASFLPLFDQRSRSNSDLVFGGADDRLDCNPVGVVGDIVDIAGCIAIAFEFWQGVDRFQSVELTSPRHDDPSVVIKTKAWCDPVVEERTVLNKLRVADLVLDPTRFALDRVLHIEGLARLHRGIDAVGANHELIIILFELSAGDADLSLKIWGDVQIKLIDGLIAFVGDRLGRLHSEVASLGKDVDLVLDRLYFRLKLASDSRVGFLVLDLHLLLFGRPVESVDDHGVVS